MKKYKSGLYNFIKCTVFLLGLVVIFVVLSCLFERKDGQFVYDGASVRAKEAEVDAEGNNTINVIFLGDSICYSSFNPLQIYAECGYTSFVCGTSAQRLCDSFVILQSVFNSQKPKIVVIETNCLYRDIRGKKEMKDRVLNALSNYFSVFQNHSRWKDAAAGMTGRHKKHLEKARGFIARKTVKSYDAGAYMYETSDVKKLDDEIVTYLNQIDELCKNEGATLVLVSAPSPKNWNYEKHNGVCAWAMEHDVSYMDLNLEEGISIDWAVDTKDGGDHLNLSGATKVSRYFGTWMKEKYNLPDNRENPSYSNWKEDSIMYQIDN